MSFQTYLTSSEPSLSQAVNSFRDSILTSTPAALEQSLWTQWRSLLELVSATPHEKQENLISFLQELRRQDNPEREDDGGKLQVWGEEFRWVNLPIFGPAVREFWDTSDPSSSSAEAKQKWINQNAFLSHLTSRSVAANDSLDFSLYGIWALRTAFEDDPAGSSPSTPLVWEVASVWLLYAGAALKKGSEEGRTWEGSIAREGVRCRGEGKSWRGLSVERWAVWKDGLLSVLEGEGAGETRRLLEAASRELGDS